MWACYVPYAIVTKATPISVINIHWNLFIYLPITQPVKDITMNHWQRSSNITYRLVRQRLFPVSIVGSNERSAIVTMIRTNSNVIHSLYLATWMASLIWFKRSIKMNFLRRDIRQIQKLEYVSYRYDIFSCVTHCTFGHIMRLVPTIADNLKCFFICYQARHIRWRVLRPRNRWYESQ